MPLIRLIYFRAPMLPDGEGFIIPASVSRDLMQFGPKVPTAHIPRKAKGMRVDLLERWGIIVVGQFRDTVEFTRFGRIVFKYGSANGRSVGVTYKDFLSHFGSPYPIHSERVMGVKQAIGAKRALFFADSPADLQFLYTVGLMPKNSYEGIAEWSFEPPDPFDIV